MATSCDDIVEANKQIPVFANQVIVQTEKYEAYNSLITTILFSQLKSISGDTSNANNIIDLETRFNILTKEPVVKVIFWSASWCSFCTNLKKDLGYGNDNNGIVDTYITTDFDEVIEIDKVDKDGVEINRPRFDAETGLTSVPVIQIFKNGTEVYNQVQTNKLVIVKEINKALDVLNKDNIDKIVDVFNNAVEIIRSLCDNPVEEPIEELTDRGKERKDKEDSVDVSIPTLDSLPDPGKKDVDVVSNKPNEPKTNGEVKDKKEVKTKQQTVVKENTTKDICKAIQDGAETFRPECKDLNYIAGIQKVVFIPKGQGWCDPHDFWGTAKDDEGNILFPEPFYKIIDKAEARRQAGGLGGIEVFSIVTVHKSNIPASGLISSSIGLRKIQGVPAFHKGIDIAVEIGTDVLCVDEGKVIKAIGTDEEFAKDSNSGGFRVNVDHPKLGIQTRYMHLSSVNVKVEQVVERGTVLGKSGNTGDSQGPHLHFQVVCGLKKSTDTGTGTKDTVSDSNYGGLNEGDDVTLLGDRGGKDQPPDRTTENNTTKKEEQKKKTPEIKEGVAQIDSRTIPISQTITKRSDVFSGIYFRDRFKALIDAGVPEDNALDIILDEAAICFTDKQVTITDPYDIDVDKVMRTLDLIRFFGIKDRFASILDMHAWQIGKIPESIVEVVRAKAQHVITEEDALALLTNRQADVKVSDDNLNAFDIGYVYLVLSKDNNPLDIFRTDLTPDELNRFDQANTYIGNTNKLYTPSQLIFASKDINNGEIRKEVVLNTTIVGIVPAVDIAGFDRNLMGGALLLPLYDDSDLNNIGDFLDASGNIIVDSKEAVELFLAEYVSKATQKMVETTVHEFFHLYDLASQGLSFHGGSFATVFAQIWEEEIAHISLPKQIANQLNFQSWILDQLVLVDSSEREQAYKDILDTITGVLFGISFDAFSYERPLSHSGECFATAAQRFLASSETRDKLNPKLRTYMSNLMSIPNKDMYPPRMDEINEVLLRVPAGNKANINIIDAEFSNSNLLNLIGAV